MEILKNDEIDAQIEKIKELLLLEKELKENSNTLCFLTAEDLAEKTGWGIKTARAIFNSPEFPCCNYGKEKVAEIHAVIEYFKVPRKK